MPDNENTEPQPDNSNTGDDTTGTSSGTTTTGGGGGGASGGKKNRSGSGTSRSRKQASSRSGSRSQLDTPKGSPYGPELYHEATPEDADESTSRGNRVPRSVMWDAAILERARAAAVYLGSYVPEAGIGNLTDIVEQGVLWKLDQLERDFFNGQPFPRVRSMGTGRPRSQRGKGE
jgi:hypothetical protein